MICVQDQCVYRCIYIRHQCLIKSLHIRLRLDQGNQIARAPNLSIRWMLIKVNQLTEKNWRFLYRKVCSTRGEQIVMAAWAHHAAAHISKLSSNCQALRMELKTPTYFYSPLFADYTRNVLFFEYFRTGRWIYHQLGWNFHTNLNSSSGTVELTFLYKNRQLFL